MRIPVLARLADESVSPSRLVMEGRLSVVQDSPPLCLSGTSGPPIYGKDGMDWLARLKSGQHGQREPSRRDGSERAGSIRNRIESVQFLPIHMCTIARLNGLLSDSLLTN